MPICAILLVKPSMQVLYERVLRRPYPRSQRHVYIGMSRSLQYLQSAFASLLFRPSSPFAFIENIPSLLTTFTRMHTRYHDIIFS